MGSTRGAPRSQRLVFSGLRGTPKRFPLFPLVTIVSALDLVPHSFEAFALVGIPGREALAVINLPN